MQISDEQQGELRKLLETASYMVTASHGPNDIGVAAPAPASTAAAAALPPPPPQPAAAAANDVVPWNCATAFWCDNTEHTSLYFVSAKDSQHARNIVGYDGRVCVVIFDSTWPEGSGKGGLQLYGTAAPLNLEDADAVKTCFTAMYSRMQAKFPDVKSWEVFRDLKLAAYEKANRQVFKVKVESAFTNVWRENRDVRLRIELPKFVQQRPFKASE